MTPGQMERMGHQSIKIEWFQFCTINICIRAIWQLPSLGYFHLQLVFFVDFQLFHKENVLSL